MTRQTVSKFFRGQPVDRQYFVQIGERLHLEWEDIVVQPVLLEDEGVELIDNSNFDRLIKNICYKLAPSIQENCGKLRILDMSYPLQVTDIYVDIYVSEKISGRQRIDLASILPLNVFNTDYFDRKDRARSRVIGTDIVEKYSKLLILGKPGSGKTTFLKFLAIKGVADFIKSEKVPIFVRLKDCTKSDKFDLFKYIAKRLFENGIKELTVIEELLDRGGALILLDGLDEIEEENSYFIFKKIQEFQERFYKNNFIMTCRTAANTYTFEGFTEVEILDFSRRQIHLFINKWFYSKSLSKGNSLFSEIQVREPLQELASNPLLLTLLCLNFENSTCSFTNYFELYQESLNVLLKYWDARRHINRGSAYVGLSLGQKTELLGKIALNTLKQNRYIFSGQELEYQIDVYLSLRPERQPQSSDRLDSESILKSIEAQHGLLVERAKGKFSFCHRIFHEYFAARRLADELMSQTSSDRTSLSIADVLAPQWHQVWRLLVEMLPCADIVLQTLCQSIEKLMAEDAAIRSLLTWVNQKAIKAEGSYQPFIVRAFYLELASIHILDLTSAKLELPQTGNPNFICQLNDELTLDLTLNWLLMLDRLLLLDKPSAHKQKVIYRIVERCRVRAATTLPALEVALEELKQRLPDTECSPNAFETWWQANSQVWLDQLRSLAVRHRDLEYHWQFSDRQKYLLTQYYNANQLLLHCFYAANAVSETLRLQIENSFLLPASHYSFVPSDTKSG